MRSSNRDERNKNHKDTERRKGRIPMRNMKKTLTALFLILTLALPVQTFWTVDAQAEEISQMQQPVKPAKLSKKTLKLKVGQKKKLVLRHADGKVTWKSKDSSIAKVGRKGVVRAKKSGKTTIIAKFAGKKYKCKVTVISNEPAERSGEDTDSNSSSGPSRSSDSSGSSDSSSDSSKSGTVYWTPGGSVYHYSRSCPTLSRSRTIYSGTPSESGKSRGCKVCG